MLSRGAFLTSGAVLCCLLAWGNLGAQGVLLEARTQVHLPAPEGVARVEVSYLVRPREGATEIPLSQLTPGPLRIESLRASLNPDLISEDMLSSGEDATRGDGEIPGFELALVRNHYWGGAAPIPPDLSREGNTLALTFNYEVHGAWSGVGRADIPLVVPLWIPADPTPETFQASIQLPPGYSVSSSFPTSPVSRASLPPGQPFELGLQAVPAVLVLRITPGEPPLFTLEGSLDVMVLFILLAMGIMGFRSLKGRSG